MLSAGELLDFEAAHTGWHWSRVDVAVRVELKITPARYYQLLHRAAASIEGQAHDPITAHRVLRLAS